MEETSLSDFIGDGEGERGGDSDEGESDGDDSAAGAGVATPAGPAVTAAYWPDGGACECCEVTVEWLWTDGENRVCRDCKDW